MPVRGGTGNSPAGQEGKALTARMCLQGPFLASAADSQAHAHTNGAAQPGSSHSSEEVLRDMGAAVMA